MDASLSRIDLAEAIGAIRDDILAATYRNTGSPLRFELGDIQMEFSVELRRDQRAKGGVKAWVVDVSAEGGQATTSVQRVAFNLKPKNATTGAGWDIANDDEGSTSNFGATGEPHA
ncbi:trypco2 family protein [Streptomyces sp. CoH27]|uniref:trypco2 family protein n=1 Tax=Streptomyces sp. CoH27 TaxID=2875763 RepID=UPI001CD6FB69|nr:trypco2 family protein [Streptomyces sp. CoH27]